MISKCYLRERMTEQDVVNVMRGRMVKGGKL